MREFLERPVGQVKVRDRRRRGAPGRVGVVGARVDYADPRRRRVPPADGPLHAVLLPRIPGKGASLRVLDGVVVLGHVEVVLRLEQGGGSAGGVLEARGDGPRDAADLVAAAARAGKVWVDVSGGRRVGLVEGEVLGADLLHALSTMVMARVGLVGGGRRERLGKLQRNTFYKFLKKLQIS